MPPDGIAQIGKYQILGQIGEGAMGVVYRALDPVLNRPVAIKVMSDALARDTDLRGRFLREAQSAGSLQHPNVVTIYDFGEVDGHPFIAMEFVEGADLDELLRNRTQLSPIEKIDILVDVLNGLAYAHKRGIVHRDVKPANIRIDEDGRARIMDFGIAHLSSSSMTRTGMTVGTPAYMSPEQITGGAIAAPSDIFAVGAVMYELFAGVQAFGGETLQNVMYKIVSAPAPELTIDVGGSPPLVSASRALGAVAARAMAKDAADRFENALDMAAALSDVRARLAGQDASGTTSLRATVARVLASTAESEVQIARRRRTKMLAIGSGVAVVGAAGVLAAVLLSLPGRQNAVAPDAPATVANAPAIQAAAPAPAPPTTAVQTAPPTPPSKGSDSKSTGRTAAAPSASELALVRELQGTALDARRRAVEAGASAAQLDSGDAHSRLASMLLFDGKATQAGEQLNAAASLWGAAERAARAASLTVSSAKTTIAETPKTQIVPQPISVPPPQAQKVAPPPEPPPANPAVDIAAVVSAYARAIESRDVAAVRRAYPGITSAQAKGWQQFFPTLRSLRVTISIGDLAVNGTNADAKLVGAYDYVTDDGKTQHQPVSFQASFRREGTLWQLLSVH
jgi:eukaryotic-like serine/threonine-protein kinase